MGLSYNKYLVIILIDVIEPFQSCRTSYEEFIIRLWTILLLEFYYDYVVVGMGYSGIN